MASAASPFHDQPSCEAAASAASAGVDDDHGAPAAQPAVGAAVSKRRVVSDGRRFQRELRAMMFGFGDVPNPLPQSVALMEEMVLDYVQQLLQRASEVSEERCRQARRGAETLRVRERDLLFVLRKDRRRYERVQELLEVWEEQKDARVGKQPEEYAKDEEE